MKILASILVLTGALGFGVCLTREHLFQIRQLEIQRRILAMMQGEITHFHRTFPDTCEILSDQCEEPYASFFREVASQMNAWQGDNLEDIWQREVERFFPSEQFAPVLHIFTELVERMNCQESTMQAQAIAFAREAMEEQLQTRKKEYIQNRRLTMWLSGIAGFVCIVLFL